MINRGLQVSRSVGRIADFKLRPPTQQFVDAAYREPLRAELLDHHHYDPQVLSVAATTAYMDELDIAWGCIQGRDLRSTHGWWIDNEHIATIVRQQPDRFIGLGGIDVSSPDAPSAVEACNQLGLAGIVVDPLLQNVSLGDRRFDDLFELCNRLELIVSVVGGPGPLIGSTTLACAHPLMVDEIAARYPDLHIVLSHAGYPWVLESITVAARHRNVYLELSGYESWPGANFYFEASKDLIRDKLLFASGFPYMDLERQLQYYGVCGLNGEAQGIDERILRQNAERALSWNQG